MRRQVPILLSVTIAGLDLLFTSCSGRYKELPESGATLEGTVTYGSDKVPAALIIVQGAEGSAQGNADDDGHFKLDNVPLGEVNVAVNTEAGKGMMRGRQMAAAQGKQKVSLPRLVDVPRRYADPTSSGIKTNIEKGPNSFNIDIPR